MAVKIGHGTGKLKIAFCRQTPRQQTLCDQIAHLRRIRLVFQIVQLLQQKQRRVPSVQQHRFEHGFVHARKQAPRLPQIANLVDGRQLRRPTAVVFNVVTSGL